VQPPTPSWGNILNEGRVALGVAWWLTLTPGFCILITVLSFNLLGEGIRERIYRG
jgi:peptide/nickel transport system permease protein